MRTKLYHKFFYVKKLVTRTFQTTYGKNRFADIFKILAKFRPKYNLDCQNNYIECSNMMIILQKILTF